MKKFFRFLFRGTLVLGFTTVLVTIAMHWLGITIAKGASMPAGLYRTSSAPLRRGDVVMIRMPESWQGLSIRRKYVKQHPVFPWKSQNLLKYVCAIQGDRVVIDSNGITVNGEPIPATAPLLLDSAGRPMPALELQTTLGSGEFLVVSDNLANGLDSRYFGILDEDNLVSRMEMIRRFDP